MRDKAIFNHDFRCTIYYNYLLEYERLTCKLERVREEYGEITLNPSSEGFLNATIMDLQDDIRAVRKVLDMYGDTMLV